MIRARPAAALALQMAVRVRPMAALALRMAIRVRQMAVRARPAAALVLPVVAMAGRWAPVGPVGSLGCLIPGGRLILW